MTRVIEAFVTPVVWTILLVAAGLVLLRCSRRKRLARLGWWLVLLAGLVLLTLSFPPVASLLAYPLEVPYPYPNAETLANLDLVVVLGAGIKPVAGFPPHAEPDGCAYKRVCAGVYVFDHCHAQAIAFCGDETAAMRDLAIRLGVTPQHILDETASQNTMENATYIVRLLPPGSNRRIGLVTCAMHMRRSEAAFRKILARDAIIPIPVDSTYEPLRLTRAALTPTADALLTSSRAIHEWIGMVWYALRYG